MATSVSIGTLFGIDIRVNWSWFVILLLVVINLSQTFRGMHPNWGTLLVWSTSILAALVFFGSVLAHELGHSLVARARGIPVRDITLHLFGGVSDLEREPESPASEFLLAVVGPLVSLLLGGMLLLITWLSLLPTGFSTRNPVAAVAGLSPLQTLVVWLGSVNVSLGLFNLIPGLPLDGGRVLRSALWALTGNLRLATRLAVAVARALAWGLIFGGIAMAFGLRVPLLGTGLGGGLWLAFIGWFLKNASAQSYQQVVIRDVLRGVAVSQLMRANPPTCHPALSLAHLFNDQMLATGDDALPVVDRGRLVGLVTLADVRRITREAWGVTAVREVMTLADQLITVAPGDDVERALDKLAASDVRQLPVLLDGQLVGMLRRRDILQWLQLHAQRI
ncbi:MAG: site-2 protease family protein [Anaerolineae bacterium]|nr:site-2 protease family protein [Anaerolineae bacterium]